MGGRSSAAAAGGDEKDFHTATLDQTGGTGSLAVKPTPSKPVGQISSHSLLASAVKATPGKSLTSGGGSQSVATFERPNIELTFHAHIFASRGHTTNGSGSSGSGGGEKGWEELCTPHLTKDVKVSATASALFDSLIDCRLIELYA